MREEGICPVCEYSVDLLVPRGPKGIRLCGVHNVYMGEIKLWCLGSHKVCLQDQYKVPKTKRVLTASQFAVLLNLLEGKPPNWRLRKKVAEVAYQACLDGWLIEADNTLTELGEAMWDQYNRQLDTLYP